MQRCLASLPSVLKDTRTANLSRLIPQGARENLLCIFPPASLLACNSLSLPQLSPCRLRLPVSAVLVQTEVHSRVDSNGSCPHLYCVS